MKKILLSAVVLMSGLTLFACKETEYVHVGPNWDMIHKVQSSEQSFNIHLSGVKSSYKLSEKLEFNINSEKPGRLWIVQVDAKDEVSLLMPNQLQSDNMIKTGQAFYFPPKGVNWSAPASEPVGKSVLAFIVTTGDADLNAVLKGQNDKKAMEKAFSIIKDKASWSLKTKVIDIQK